MKVQLEPDEFATATAYAVRAIPTKVVQPVLAGAVLSAKDGSLRLSAFDYELSLAADITADVADPGRILVPGRMLAAIAKVLPGKPVTLTLEETSLRVQCGAGEYRLPTLPIGDYPTLPKMPKAVGRVPAEALAEAVDQVATVAATDVSTDAGTTVVVLEMGLKSLRLMATDRFRIAIKTMPWSVATHVQEVSAAVPAAALRAFATGLGEGEVTLHAEPDASNVGFSDDVHRTTIGLSSVEPPPYTRFMGDPGSSVAVTADTADLQEAAKRLAVFAGTEQHGPFTLTFSNDGIEATAESTKWEGSGGREQLPATITTPNGDPLQMAEPVAIGFQARFLTHALACVHTPRVRLDLTNGVQPVYIRPVDSDNGPDDGYRYVLAPVRRDGRQ